MVEFNVPVPGNLTLIDHAIFRTDKGAVGFLKASRGCAVGLWLQEPCSAGLWLREPGGGLRGGWVLRSNKPYNSGLLVVCPLPQVRPQGSDKRRDICECRLAVCRNACGRHAHQHY